MIHNRFNAFSRCFFFMLLALLTPLQVHADSSNWQFDAQLRFLLSNYSDSNQRNHAGSTGFLLSADYLDKYAFNMGFGISAVNLKTNLTNISEKNFLIGGTARFYPDWVPGRLSIHFDTYLLTDEGSNTAMSRGRGKQSVFITQSSTEDVSVLNPRVSFLNRNKSFLFEVGFARTEYKSNDIILNDLIVEQWAPKLGIGFNNKYDWLQLSGFFIKLNSNTQFSGDEDAQGLDVTWIHWPDKEFMNIESFHFGALIGERMFAVDSDAKLVYTFSEIQTQAYSLGIRWKLSKLARLFILGGIEDNESMDTQEMYRNQFYYISLSQRW